MKSNFQKWYAESPYASYLRAFVTLVVANAVADFVKLGHFDFSNWEAWVIPALAALFPPVSRVLNPKDELTLG